MTNNKIVEHPTMVIPKKHFHGYQQESRVTGIVQNYPDLERLHRAIEDLDNSHIEVALVPTGASLNDRVKKSS